MTPHLYGLCSGTACPAELSERLRAEWDRQRAKTPGFGKRVVSFLAAAARHVAAGCPTVTPEEQSRRLSLCVVCPEYTAGGTCAKCGCDLKPKAAWALESCPLGKW
jgi:hypothetical protein